MLLLLLGPVSTCGRCRGALLCIGEGQLKKGKGSGTASVLEAPREMRRAPLAGLFQRLLSECQLLSA